MVINESEFCRILVRELLNAGFQPDFQISLDLLNKLAVKFDNTDLDVEEIAFKLKLRETLREYDSLKILR